jgi:hypothetical protein
MLHAPPAGAATEIPLARQGVHRVARRDPVAHIRSGVERIEQNNGVRATTLEGDRDVTAHRRRRHHQHLDTGGPGDRQGWKQKANKAISTIRSMPPRLIGTNPSLKYIWQ